MLVVPGRPSFDYVQSVVTVAKFAEVACTGLGSLDAWSPYRCESSEVFDLLAGHTTVLRKRPLDGDAPLGPRELPARSVRPPVDRLLSMDETRAQIFSPDVALGLVSDAIGGDLHEDELTAIQIKTMATTGTSLGRLMIHSTFAPVFTETSTPLASYAI